MSCAALKCLANKTMCENVLKSGEKMMEDSIQVARSGGYSPIRDAMRNGFVEQTQILSQLSRELDEYFALKSRCSGR